MRRAAWARTSCYRSAPAAPAVASTRMRKSARPARRRCTNAAPSTAKHAPIGKACAPCVECRSSTLRATARALSSGEQAKKRKSENDRSLGISAKLHRLLRSDGGSAFWREEQHRKPTVGLRLDSRRTNQLAPPRHSCLIGRRVRVRYCFIVSRVLAAEVIRFARCLLARSLSRCCSALGRGSFARLFLLHHNRTFTNPTTTPRVSCSADKKSFQSADLQTSQYPTLLCSSVVGSLDSICSFITALTTPPPPAPLARDRAPRRV